MCSKPCFGVMMGHQLGLGLCCVWKLFFQYLGDLLVILLAFALEQRLIGRVLNQRVLEEIRRVRRHAALVEQLRLN